MKPILNFYDFPHGKNPSRYLRENSGVDVSSSATRTFSKYDVPLILELIGLVSPWNTNLL